MMIFDGVPKTVYLTDGAGNIIKASVTSASYSMGLDYSTTMTIECMPQTLIKKQELADIDPAVFEALLEDEHGRYSEVPEEIAEEAAQES